MNLVRSERRGAVAEIVLARAEAGNALVPELLEDLLSALAAIGGDDSVHAVLLRAQGAAFSLGGDMRRFAAEMSSRDGASAYSARLVGRLNDAILALAALPQPVIAAVHGPVTGGAIGLVLASDLVYLGPRASFKAHYVTAGFAPDGGWTALLPQRIGQRRAALCLLANSTVGAPQAVAWGLANELVAEGELEAHARAAAQEIAARPQATVRAAKRLLGLERAALARALEAERQEFVALIAADEARRGIAAFLESFGDYPRGDAYSAPPAGERASSCS